MGDFNGNWKQVGGGLENVVEDETPELGGDLSLNSFSVFQDMSTQFQVVSNVNFEAVNVPLLGVNSSVKQRGIVFESTETQRPMPLQYSMLDFIEYYYATEGTRTPSNPNSHIPDRNGLNGFRNLIIEQRTMQRNFTTGVVEGGSHLAVQVDKFTINGIVYAVDPPATDNQVQVWNANGDSRFEDLPASQSVKTYLASRAMTADDIGSLVLMGSNDIYTLDSTIGEVGDEVMVANIGQGPEGIKCFVNDNSSGPEVLVAVGTDLVNITHENLEIQLFGWVKFIKTASNTWRGYSVSCNRVGIPVPVPVEFLTATRTTNWNVNVGSYTELPFDRTDKETDVNVLRHDDTDSSKFIAVVDGYYTGAIQIGLFGDVDVATRVNGTIDVESEREIHQPSGESTISAVLFSGQLSAGDELQFSFKTPSSGTITAFSKLMFQRVRN